MPATLEIDPLQYRLDAVEYAIDQGWLLVPLNGKKPTLKNWPALTPTAMQMRSWARAGNVGLRTGRIYVIDRDPGGDVSGLDLPDTRQVETGAGGEHYYYSTDVELGNTASKLAPHVDTRGYGGQVVFPGSIHPTTGRMYRWANNLPVADLPAHIIARLTAKPVAIPSNAYARAAMEKEIAAVIGAPPKTHNDTLNRAAFSLGQLVGGGQLDEGTVRAALLRAARCPEGEAIATIASGIEAGKLQPRGVPERVRRAPHLIGEANELPAVLTPGPHETDEGVYIEIGNDDFVRRVVEAIPHGELYVSGGLLGEVTGEPGARRFLPGKEDRIRSVIDRHVRLIRWFCGRGKNAIPEQRYIAGTRDHAALVMASAGLDDIGPAELKGIINAPTMREDGTILDRPGYDTATMLLYDPGSVSFPTIPANPTRDDARAAYFELAEPFVEFPFVDQKVGIAVTVSFVLTLVCRHAIAGPCPMCAARASTPGSGKDLLVNAICTAGIGRDPAQDNAPTGSDSENEFKKSILAYAIEKHPAVLLGNVDRPLGSGALADALTKRSIRSRLLGFNRTAEAPLLMVWFATGNGLTFKGDLGRRVIPIDLYSDAEHPEDREGPAPEKNWTHPELVDYVRQERPRLVTAALTLMRAFHLADRPRHGKPLLGSYYVWDRLIRSAVIWAGGADPLDACQTVREEGDADLDALRGALSCWRDALPEPATAAAAVRTAKALPDSELLTALATLAGCATTKLDGRSLGYALKHYKDRPVSGLRFRTLGEDRKTGSKKWGVERCQ